MPADHSVRPALLSDAPRMGLIQVGSWRATHAGELGEDVVAGFDAEEFADAWAQALATYGPSPEHRLLVACDGPAVVGFAATQPSPDPDAPGEQGGDAHGPSRVRELTALFVEPASWRQGHGSRLLAAACDLARESGAEEMRVWVTGGDAARAQFLQSAGFEMDGGWRTSEIAPGRTLTERRWAAQL